MTSSVGSPGSVASMATKRSRHGADTLGLPTPRSLARGSSRGSPIGDSPQIVRTLRSEIRSIAAIRACVSSAARSTCTRCLAMAPIILPGLPAMRFSRVRPGCQAFGDRLVQPAGVFGTRRLVRQAAYMTGDSELEPVTTPLEATMASKKKARKPRTKKAAAEKKPRKHFTPEQRAAILAEAKEQKLTGTQIAEKYGISKVTYYLWRQKSGGAKRRQGGRSAARVGAGDGLGHQLRAAVQGKIREMLPCIVQQEVANYLDSVLGPRTRLRKGR